MNLFKLFSFSNNEPEVDRLEIAEAYIAQVGESGLTSHYNARGVQDCVEMATGVKLSNGEAVMLVQEYRIGKGRKMRPASSFYPGDGEVE